MFILSILSFSFISSQVDYNEIQAIFDNSCNSCHDDSNPSGGLNLLSYDELMSTAADGVVVPYNSQGSDLYDRITRSDSQSGDMPPSSNDSLSDAEIELIKDWIDEGAFSQPAGCLDSEAYNCEDSEAGLYVQDIGGIVYDNSCTTCSDDTFCTGYYNPNAELSNGICYYPQAPGGDEVVFTVEEGSIHLDWSAFDPPELANLEYYRIQRCVGETCTPLGGPPFQITDTQITDSYDWQNGDEIKYIISVQYEYNPYWGWANEVSTVVLPGSDCLAGDINGDELLNVLDVVTMIQLILGADYDSCADVNDDELLNVLDVVSLINIILSGGIK